MTSSRTFRGLGVCPGIAFGRVHLIDRRRVTVPHYHIEATARPREVERFERAIDSSEAQLEDLEGRADETGLPQVKALLSAHAMILRDAALRDTTVKRILDDGQNAEWALQDTVRQIKGLFDRLDEDYFRERRSDVDIVGDRVLRNLVGEETELLNHLSDDAIVVAYDLSPADTVALAKFAARAFVTERGGRTSHTAILARALDVPCVLNARGVMEFAGSGDALIVDGRSGEVVLRPTDTSTGRYRSLERRRRREDAALLADRDLPAVTTDGVRVALLGNIEVSQEIQPLLEKGAEGVGLYRTEFLQIEQPNLAGAASHAEVYRRVVRAMSGCEVTIRTFDEGGDKELRPHDLLSVDTLIGATGGDGRGGNPALGLRAIRLSLQDEPLFSEQLEGILLASRAGPVNLLLPFITTLDELRAAKALIEAAKAKVEAESGPLEREVPVGVMIETPAAAMIADHLAPEVDFFSVGTNDLLQYILAADRANDLVSYLYRATHPAILRTLRHISQIAAEHRTPITVCGEIAGDPFHTPLLVGLGYRRLSMTGGSIPLVKRMIRRLDAAACRAFAEEACGLATASEIEELLTERLRTWASDVFSG